MRFVDSVGTTPVQLLYLLAISGLKRTKDAHVAGLQLVGRMGRQPAKGNVVFKAKLKYFNRLVGAKAIVDQNAFNRSDDRPFDTCATIA